MIGSTLKSILDQRGISANELSRRIGTSAQTLYSIINRDTKKIDPELIVKICDELDVPIELFFGGRKSSLPQGSELEMLRKYRRLDEHGKRVTDMVIDCEYERVCGDEVTKPSIPAKIIPLYSTPAAAGYANPILGSDYEDYSVPADSRADFAARIQGDSMEPYIEDGSIVLVSRNSPLTDGDVGLFFVDGDSICKQYCEDCYGNVYLFSLNRDRADADRTITANSGLTVFCFGKVLLDKRPNLPIL